MNAGSTLLRFCKYTPLELIKPIHHSPVLILDEKLPRTLETTHWARPTIVKTRLILKKNYKYRDLTPPKVDSTKGGARTKSILFIGVGSSASWG